ncbi:MAG TPA: ATP-dependent zinc metalloprotease FtsH [Polyangiales bacterium]|nr:ATP-dependent zinc metalloprotease FtsH [Polyangiales bacterium]
MQEKARFHIIYLVVAVASVLLVQQFLHEARTVALVPYSEFQQLLKERKISEVEIVADTLQGTLKEPKGGKQRFVTTRVEPELAKELDEAGVRYARREENTLLPQLLSWIVPALLFFAIWAFFIRRLADRAGPGGGLMAVGKSKAKVYVETDTRVTFADVAGVDEAKTELQETVAFLKDPASYGRLGARMPKGVLLVGPPGTGKTLIARAVAGEAGVPFFSISGSEFVEMFVGVGAARVRDLFEQARKQAPSIIFIDELDALGRSRNAAPYAGGHDEKEQTLNQLLVEMDGFDGSSGVVLIAATNRPEILDPALLRAGRFDRQVLVDRPEKIGRLDILKVHVRKAKLAPALNLEAVAALTPGFTGADLANLVNEAAIVATRRGADEVTLDDFTAAIERIVAGLEKKNRLLNPLERRIVAYHESGHALVARCLPGQDPVQKISIIPRGIGALGYTLQRPTEDRYLMTRTELENKLTVLLGGRAAEHIVFGHLSTGAADDLSKATDIARSMAMRYAMVPELGNVAYDSEQSPFLGAALAQPSRRAYSDDTARQIDAAIRNIVDNAFQSARELLSTQRPLLEAAAARLLEKETLTEEDLAELWMALQIKPSETPAISS